MTHFEIILKEQPSNIFADEVPLETSWLTQMMLLPIHTLLTTNKPLVVGYAILLIFYMLTLGSSLFLSKYIDNYYPLLFWVFIPLGSILWLILSASVCFYNISTTTKVLKSISDEMINPSSHLWIALQSNFMADSGYGAQVEKKELEDWRKRLTADYSFCCPILQNNLRNSKPVSDIGMFTWDGAASASCVDRASIPKAPPSLPSTSAEESLYIPLSSISKLKAAVRHAYNHAVVGKPKVLVVILDDEKMIEDVTEGLSLEGLDVVTYYKPDDRHKCEAFIRNPKGALVTSGLLFSGMEATSVIWVMGTNPLFRKSNIRRVIDKICIISTDLRQMGNVGGFGLTIDPTFARCSLPWPSILSRCKARQCEGRIFCNSCVQVCLPSEGRGHGSRWDWLPTVRHWLLLPLTNPCSCSAMIQCKLEDENCFNQDLWIYACFVLVFLALIPTIFC